MMEGRNGDVAIPELTAVGLLEPGEEALRQRRFDW